MTNLQRNLLASVLLGSLGLMTPGSCRAATYTTNAMADAFVTTGPTGNLSNNNYGGGGALSLAATGLPNGEFQSVLKFDFSGAKTSFDGEFGVGQWSIQSIALQLTSSPHNNAIYNAVAPGAFGLSLMHNNSWVEGTGTASTPTTDGISFNTLQNVYIDNAADQALGSFNFPGGTSGANSYTLELTSGLTTDVLSGSEASLRAFAADSAVSYLFSSRAATATEPELIITVVPEPAPLVLLGLPLLWLLLRFRPRLRAMETEQELGYPR